MLQRIKKWFWRPFRLLGFILFYNKEIFMSNMRVAYDILSPVSYAQEKITVLSLKALTSEIQVVVLMNLITMTPGTISLDYDSFQKKLRVHMMFRDEEQDLQQKINRIYVPFLKEVF